LNRNKQTCWLQESSLTIRYSDKIAHAKVVLWAIKTGVRTQFYLI